MHLCTFFALPGFISVEYQISNRKRFWSRANPTFSPTFLITIHAPAQQPIQLSLGQISIITSMCCYYWSYYCSCCWYYYYLNNNNNNYYYNYNYSIIHNVCKTNCAIYVKSPKIILQKWPPDIFLQSVNMLHVQELCK